MSVDYAEIESSQKQRHECLKHQEEMYAMLTQSEYMIFSMLKPRIFIDGNQWCVLYGENLQDGVSGFGDSPYEAVKLFNDSWNKKLNSIPINPNGEVKK